MFLHAWRLELPHPTTGAPLRLEAPLPEELLEVLSRLNLSPPGGAAGARPNPRTARER
jgi:23S rRNA pseudouridine955/2504/2580 synthase